MSSEYLQPELISAPVAKQRKNFLRFTIGFVLLHAFLMLFRYGSVPTAPLVPDEIIINDPAISIAHGHGYVSESMVQSKYGLDQIFAHFPPIYPYIESVAFRVMGPSVYALRATTTAMSLLASVLLLFVTLRFCRAGWMSWSSGVLVVAVYCTNASLISLERMARMESTISVLVMASLLCIAIALTSSKDTPVWPWTAAAAVFAAMTIAVHPEAMTAVLILGPLLLFVVPLKPRVRVAILALLVLVPTSIALMAYGSKIFVAIEQFFRIAHDSRGVNRSSYEWFVDLVTDYDISAINRNVFLASIMVLFAAAPVVVWIVRRNQERTELQRKFAFWFALACTVDFVLMIVALRMDDRRCQFLLGPLLLGNAMCLSWARPVGKWKQGVVWALVVVQVCASTFYLSTRDNRSAEMNPDRYLSLIRRIPPGVSVGANPGFWLDFEEAHRPFTLLLYGLDGEQVWAGQHHNPLEQFDVILYESYYNDDRRWMAAEASDNRKEQDFRVGSHVVSVYTRSGVELLPAKPGDPAPMQK